MASCGMKYDFCIFFTPALKFQRQFLHILTTFILWQAAALKLEVIKTTVFVIKSLAVLYVIVHIEFHSFHRVFQLLLFFHVT